jgi:hypothetical protein
VRKLAAFLGGMLILVLAGQASAQQLSSSFGAIMSGSNGSSSTTTTSSFFSQSMLGSRVQTPTPLNFNIRNMMPTYSSSLQNSMLLRNVSSGPQMSIQTFRLPAPTPPQSQSAKKKWFWQ